MISSCYLNSILTYIDGYLFWKFRSDRSKAWNTRWAGKKAGYHDKSCGYYKIIINKNTHFAHKIIAAMHNIYGDEIDHIDCDRLNNLVSNLRPATRSENMHNKKIQSNNTSGIKGISYLMHRNKKTFIIKANVTKNNKQNYKYFKNTEEGIRSAIKWLEDTRKILHTNFLNNG